MSTSLRLFVLTISLFLASLPAAVKADLEKQYDQERIYSKMGVIACNYLLDKSQWTDPYRGNVYIDKEGRVFSLKTT